MLYEPASATKSDKWSYIHKIPDGHNITTTVACNYNDEAIFTFMTDAQLNFKTACLELSKLDPQDPNEDGTAPENGNALEMYYAFKML